MILRNTIKEFDTYLGDKESLLDKHHKNISEKIALHWGYAEFYDYIAQLFVVEKDRNRCGLSLDTMREISKLQDIHEKEFPKIRPKHKNSVILK